MTVEYSDYDEWQLIFHLPTFHIISRAGSDTQPLILRTVGCIKVRDVSSVGLCVFKHNDTVWLEGANTILLRFILYMCTIQVMDKWTTLILTAEHLGPAGPIIPHSRQCYLGLCQGRGGWRGFHVPHAQRSPPSLLLSVQRMPGVL